MRARSESRRRLLIAIALLIALVGIGTAWYALVEGFSAFDALYQVVITASTVGYAEVRPLDTSGRLFTMVLIVSGIGIVFYVAGAIVEEMLVGRLADAFGVGRLSRRVRHMRDHYVICGYGRVGMAVADELQAHGIQSIVLDWEEGNRAMARDRGLTALSGDATDEHTLREAHTETARALIAATESDAANTFIALTARALNPDIFIVAGARGEAAERRLRTAGANRVFSMHRITGRRMALAAIQPMVVEVVDTAVGGASTVLAEVFVADEAEELAGKTLHEVFHEFRSVSVLGLERPGGGLVVAPPDDTVLRHGDRLMLYGEQEDIEGIHGDRTRPGFASGD